MSSPNVLAVIAAACMVTSLIKQLSRCSKEPLYPPGPKPLPLLGNIHDIPLVSPWIAYTEWGRTYGQLHARHSIPFCLLFFCF